MSSSSLAVLKPNQNHSCYLNPQKYFMLILGVYTRVEKYANWIQENAEYTYIEPPSSGTKMTSSTLSFSLLVILLKYMFY